MKDHIMCGAVEITDTNKKRAMNSLEYYSKLRKKAYRCIDAPKMSKSCYEKYNGTLGVTNQTSVDGWHEWILLQQFLEKVYPGSVQQLDAFETEDHSNFTKLLSVNKEMNELLSLVGAFKSQYKNSIIAMQRGR